MTLNDAIEAATREANESKLPMAVVNDPVANAEDESGPYGYCPLMAKNILFKWGVVEKIIHPARGMKQHERNETA